MAGWQCQDFDMGCFRCKVFSFCIIISTSMSSDPMNNMRNIKNFWNSYVYPSTKIDNIALEPILVTLHQFNNTYCFYTYKNAHKMVGGGQEHYIANYCCYFGEFAAGQFAERIIILSDFTIDSNVCLYFTEYIRNTKNEKCRLCLQHRE